MVHPKDPTRAGRQRRLSLIHIYGLITNKNLLEKAGYTTDDIKSFADLKKVAEDITARKDELGFAAFTSAGMDSLLSSADGFSTPVIADFYDGCALESQDGLQAGDEFYKIDGERVYIYSDVAMLLARNTTGKFDLELRRDGQTVKLSQFPMEKQTFTVDGQEVELYGMQFATEKKTAGGLLKMAWNNSLYFVQLVKLGLHDLVTGAVGLKDMSGPVGIVKIISDTGNAAKSVSDGVSNVLYLGAFIAINLAVMNLLPLPALDGGRIVCLLLTAIIEGISRKKLNPKYEGYVHTAGMVLLLALMLFITFHDVFVLFTGGST